MGAGVSGVSSAYELALGGHSVTVFERRHSVAAEGSFAETGICTSFAPLPWGLPGVRHRVMARWAGQHAALRMGSAMGWLRWGWWWQHWRAGGSKQASTRAAALQALALSSRHRLDALVADLELSFEQAPGALVLLRTPRDMELVRRALEADLQGQHLRLIDANACRQLEPNLNPDSPLAGALHLPHGSVGNARQLTQQLKAAAQRLGARFEFGTTVLRLQPGPQPGIATAQDADRKFDAVVVCAGAGSAALLAQSGLALPLHSGRHFALTAPVGYADDLPRMGPLGGVIDARSGIAIARMGDRVRVTGASAFTGSGRRLLPWAMTSLYRALETHYPGAAIGRQAQQWEGWRSRLPDGAPLIGASGLPGVWLNTAHGATGWPLACGSAQLLAEQLAGRRAPDPLAWFGVERLR